MGLFKRSQREPATTLQGSTSHDETSSSKMSIFDLFSSQKTRVTEASLQVWRNLPGEIRHDPSMVCFQREAERWKGKVLIRQLVDEFRLLSVDLYSGQRPSIH